MTRSRECSSNAVQEINNARKSSVSHGKSTIERKERDVRNLRMENSRCQGFGRASI